MIALYVLSKLRCDQFKIQSDYGKELRSDRSKVTKRVYIRNELHFESLLN